MINCGMDCNCFCINTLASASKELKRPFSPAINLSLSQRSVNRHPRHERLAKNSSFAALFKALL
jgi:hypothetical protein